MSPARRKRTSSRRPSSSARLAVRRLTPPGVSNQTLMSWVAAARRRLPFRSGSVSVVIADPRTMTKLNRVWRRKPHPTNVLSFQLTSGQRTADSLENAWGEIILCPAVIRKEARSQNRTYRSYLRFLLEHGLIHLYGLDHHTPRQQRAWERYERRLRSRSK